MKAPSLSPAALVAALAATAALLFTAAPAQANTNVSVSFDGHIRGLATFIPSGDWLRICDRRKDNLPVAVRFSYIRKNGTRQTGTHWHTAGVDGLGNRGPEGERRKGCSYGNHNFGEGRSVWFQACVRHAGGALTCSKTVRTTA
jgi:hypothetical protein